jgi:chromosomal replication initiator protein
MDRNDFVPAIDRELQALLGERRHANWFQKTTRMEVHGDELIVFAGSPYLQSWMQRQFRSLLLQAARAVLGSGARVRFEVDATLTVNDAPAPSPAQPQAGAAPPASPTAPRGGQTIPNRRKFAALSDFIAGSANQLALTAARQVGENPGGPLNPLFLHGPVGVGKTHLIEGIYREVRRTFPALQVLYLTAENFSNYFTQALREKNLPAFHQKFRGVDVLLVDDVDFFDGKKGLQEEFLHTLRSLEAAGRQIVLTCSCHPRLLTKSCDELITRYQSGMSSRLEAPNEETRVQIVRQLVQRQPFAVADDALDYVARRFAGNVRELLGGVNCLQTLHSMTKTRVTLRMAREILSRLERDCVRIVRLADVEMAICRLFHVTSDELKSPNRGRSVSQPRMLAMYLSRRLTPCAYTEIGNYYGGRNHSTVMAAEKKVQQLIDSRATLRVAAEEWPVRDLIDSLEAQLKAGA